MTAPRRLGKYEIRRQLGKGSMGIVYEGYDALIERRAAIKVIRQEEFDAHQRPELLARLKREAQAAGRLNHPGIVSVYDYGEDTTFNGGEVAYFAMELIDGRELRDLFDSGQRFTPRETERIMLGLLAALQHAHDRGVTHRDIKPSNVMLLADGSVKVTDFGVARIDRSELTQTGMVLGTPTYMAPEQMLGLEVDGRADLFACGVVLYQFLTGERPFTGSVTTVIQKVLNEPVDPPSHRNSALVPAWDAVLNMALAKKPEQRFATARAFATAIQRATLLQQDADSKVLRPSDGTTIARPVATDPQSPAPTLRPMQAAALLALAGMAVGGYWWSQSGTRVPEGPGLTPPASAVARLAPSAASTSSVITASSAQTAAVKENASSAATAVVAKSGNDNHGPTGSARPEAGRSQPKAGDASPSIQDRVEVPATATPVARTTPAASEPSIGLTARTATRAPAPSAGEIEKQAWSEASGVNSAAAYRAFLQGFPTGRFAGRARVRLAVLEPRLAAPAPMPSAARGATMTPPAAAAASGAAPAATLLITRAAAVPQEKIAAPSRQSCQDDAGVDRRCALILGYYHRSETKDFTQAVKWFRAGADQGEARAQYELAMMYYRAQGVARNNVTGFDWAKKAADQGFALAQNRVGVSFERGEGVAQNVSTAVEWYRKAAAQGESYGQNNVGRMLIFVRGVPQDPAQAYEFFGRSAAQGNPYAAYNLAYMFENGLFVMADKRTAARWYRTSLGNGLEAAVVRDGGAETKNIERAMAFIAANP